MNSDKFLLKQGEAIANALVKQGYIAKQLGEKLQWETSQPDDSWWFLLTFLPRPVSQWRFLPAIHDENQTKLYSIVEATIGGRR